MTSSRVAMTWKECMNLSDLSEDELADLAARNFESDCDDAELDRYLATTPEGRLCVRAALSRDIQSAVASGDVHRSASLKHVLLRFMQVYSARIV